MRRTLFTVKSRRKTYCLNRLLSSGIPFLLAEGEKGELVISVAYRDAVKAEALFRREEILYEISGYRGIKTSILRFAKRPFLILSVLLSLIGVILFENFSYGYSIRGNALVNRSSIVAVLREKGADGFRLKSSLDLVSIKREIAALDGVSFASVKFVGTRLQVEIKESLPAEEVTEPRFEPILSAYSAVVTKIVAESGTPRVRSGDVVRPGDLLIEPVYAFTEGDAPAPAAGEVWGVVTHVKEVTIPAFRVESVLTGEVTRVRSVKLFGNRIGKESAPPYSLYDLEERVIYRGMGAEVTEKIYRQREDRIFYHDLDAEADSFAKKALEELLSEIGRAHV